MKYFFYLITGLLYVFGSFVVGSNVRTFQDSGKHASFAVILGSVAFVFAAVLGHSILTRFCSGIGVLADLVVTGIWLLRTRNQS